MNVELVASAVHILIRRLPAWIGRSPLADVLLDDPEISHYHCCLFEQDSLLLIRDADSAHGTFVNGRRVQRRVLTSGDCVSAGRTRFLVLFGPVSGSVDESASQADLAGDGGGVLPERVASIPTPAAAVERGVPPRARGDGGATPCVLLAAFSHATS